MGRICTLRMYLVVNVFLDLFHHAYFFVGTRKAGSRAPAPAHAFHSCSSWSGGYLSLSIGSPSFPTRTGPAETRNQTAPKEKKENISISDCLSLSLAKQEANNTPRRNKPLRRQRAGDTAEPLLIPPAEAEEQGGGRSRGLQEERWGSRSLGEGEASTSCWRGTRARRRA
jgi:hypothetical protein